MEYASWNFATLYLIGLVQSSPIQSPVLVFQLAIITYPVPYKYQTQIKLQFFKQLINFLINDTLTQTIFNDDF